LLKNIWSFRYFLAVPWQALVTWDDACHTHEDVYLADEDGFHDLPEHVDYHWFMARILRANYLFQEGLIDAQEAERLADSFKAEAARRTDPTEGAG
jgi:hypothetical protein